MATLSSDFQHSLRSLGKDLSVTITMTLLLSLGIGATTAFFSVIHAVIIKPLPYNDPDRIVIFSERTHRGYRFTSHKNVLLWRKQHRIFESIAEYKGARYYVAGTNRSYQVTASLVSANFFSVLGIPPLLGRGFLPEEEQPGKEHVVILSHGFWRDHFGGSPDVLGKSLALASTKEDLNGQIQTQSTAHVIVGVMPPEFKFPFTRPAPFWIPRVAKPGPVTALARLKPGIDLKQARAAMSVFAKQLEAQEAKRLADLKIDLDRLKEKMLEDNQSMLLFMLGAAAFMLLIACTNVANLLLVRTTVRHGEIAVRMALGASRWRIVRLLLVEGVLLGAGGGLLGLVLTYWMMKLLIGLCPVDVPRLNETSLNVSVLSFALGVSFLTGLSCAILPAWRVSDVRVGQILKEAGRSLIGRGRRHLHATLVICEIGLSLILLMGAGLMIRSLTGLQRIGLGFDPRNVLVMHIDLPMAIYTQPRYCKAFVDPLVQRIQGLPSVISVATMAHKLDLSTGPMGMNVSIPDRTSNGPDQEHWIRYASVSSEFFATMGIKFLKGRTFTEHDNRSHIIIDETLAKRCFGETNPVGQTVICDRDIKLNVIGVVGTTREFESPDVDGSVFMRNDNGSHGTAVVIRTDSNPENLTKVLRAEVATRTKDQVIAKLEPLEVTLAHMLAPRYFTMVLLSLFAFIAMILVAVGIYGLLQYSITQQTRDIGIRMALGAKKADVLKTVLRQGLKLTLIGVVLGVVGALALTRVLSSLLYGITPMDAMTLACVSVVLTVVALLASYIPARRASQIDPIEALRYE